MVRPVSEVRRGSVVWAELDPVRGRERAARRSRLRDFLALS